MSRFLSILALLVFLADDIQAGKVAADSAKPCASMICGRSERCMNRKFWCKNPPCPSMIYCSKTTKESLKGPTTCENVRCSKGYICLVKARRCHWDQKCMQQIARCVSEREYYDGSASCADFRCPYGQKCILRESLCAYPPCKLLKSCAKSKDVNIWHSRCKTLGCQSEYECFLRKPPDNCPSVDSCKHTPDCIINNIRKVLMNPECRGWICPRHQQCSALVPKSCDPEKDVENCKIERACHGPLAISDTTSSASAKLSPRTTTTPTKTLRVKNSELSSIPTDNYHHEDQRRPTMKTTSSVIEAGTMSTPTQRDCDPNNSEVHGNRGMMQLEKWSPKNGSIYRVPVYVRSAVNILQSPEVEESSTEKRPTENTITQRIDYLRTKTGVDAIMMHTEENRKYQQFIEWLDAVKTILGPSRFEIWLEGIKKLASEYPAFQKWLMIKDEITSFAEDRFNGGNRTEEQTSTPFSEPKQNSELNNEKSDESRKSGDSKTDFHSPTRSKNGSLIFPVDRITPRKNAGHPRINYGRNRVGYNRHRGFGPRELKNETTTLYRSNSSTEKNDRAANSEQRRHDFQKENENEKLEVPFGFNNFGGKTSDQIRNHSGRDPSSLFDTLENPERNFNPDRNSSVNVDVKKEENLTKMYNLFTPVEDDLHVTSPWDALRVVDHEKKTYYTLMEFPSEEGNSRVQIIGYPVIVSRPSSRLSESNIPTKNQGNSVNISPDFQSNKDPRELNPANPLKQILQRQMMPSPTLKRQPIDSKSQQSWSASQDQEQNTKESFYVMPKPSPTSAHLQNRYQSDNESPQRVSDVIGTSKLPKDFDDTGITNLEGNSESLNDTLSSQEYMDAYIDALIEHVLSKVITSESLQRGESSVSWKIPKNSTSRRVQEDHPVDSIRGAQFLEELNERYNNNSSLQAKTKGQQIVATSIPNISTDSVIREIDYQYYQCEDGEMNGPTEIGKKILPVETSDDEVEEYYSEEINEQQEYIEGSPTYQYEYLDEAVETNSTDYDF